jgi:nucleotide-binding universal stress UspA family protein
MEERTSAEATRRSTTSTRTPAQLVIAAVHPFDPDAGIIEAAARLAADHDADLLVIAAVRTIVAASPYVVPHHVIPLDEVRAALFAETAVLLCGSDVRWSVQACHGSTPEEVHALARSLDVRAVVVGRGGWRWRRVGRQARVVTVR